MARKSIDVFNELPAEIKSEVYGHIENYLSTSEGLSTLSEVINKLTGLETDRKSVSRLISQLGFPKKTPDDIRKSRIDKLRLVTGENKEERIKDAEEELIKQFGKDNLINEYNNGVSLQVISKKVGLTMFYTKNILVRWGVEIRDLPKTHEDIIDDAKNNGYFLTNIQNEYHNNNLTVNEFSIWLSEIVDYDVSLRMAERIIGKYYLHKPLEDVKHNRGRKSRDEYKEALSRLNQSGFKSVQELADFFYKNKHVTYDEMVFSLNSKLSDSDQLFTARWLERHMMPLLPEDRLIGVSRLELSVKHFLVSILGEEAIESSNRKIARPKEIDIYVPSKNIAIEVNGLWWHSEQFGRDKNYHYDKWKACHDKGVQLITVWEDDWNNNREIVESFLTHKLGVSTDQKIGSRKTYVSELTHRESFDFLETNHIQGGISGVKHFGLKTKIDNALVAVMVLQGNNSETIIARYATNAIVQGGFTKLLSHVERNYATDRIVSFSDNEVSDGGMYLNNGFTVEKELRPDYSYVFKDERKHKFSFRKDKFKISPELKYVEGLTERELADLNGLYRIYDCGKVKWSKSI